MLAAGCRRSSMLLFAPSIKRFATTNVSTNPANTSINSIVKTSSIINLERTDVMPMSEYKKIRKSVIPVSIESTKLHKVNIGSRASFLFFNYDLLWIQFQEMLLRDEADANGPLTKELRAHNQLVPKGSDIPGMLNLQVDNTDFLYQLAHAENNVYFSFTHTGKTHKIMAITIYEGMDRISKEGRTSPVHFLRFPFTTEQVRLFVSKDAHEIAVGIDHPNYTQSTKLKNELIEKLKSYFNSKR